MSQSPSQLSVYELRNGPFMRNQRRLYEMIREGMSFSGHERNCCFLNLGNARFADVSLLSGFDFPDDGRAVAITDWDRDGDLDAWVSNHTGPRLRFLENRFHANAPPWDVPSDENVARNKSAQFPHLRRVASFLQFQLEGVRCNRDAIGARMTILQESDPRPLTRAVHAGQGYLAQSTKVLHFGLGANANIEEVVIRWPDGEVQSAAGIRPNQRYRWKQGESPQPESCPRAVLDQPATGQTSSDAHRQDDRDAPYLRLYRPLPLPDLELVDAAGEKIFPTDRGRQHRIVHLWSQTCAPCLAELKEFHEATALVEAHAIGIHAVNIDLTAPSPTVDGENIRAAYDGVGAPGILCFASPRTLELLQVVCDTIYAKKRALPVPVSFLLTKDGALAAVYKGPVSPEALVADAKELEKHGSAWPKRLDAERWVVTPSFDPLFLVSQLIDRGFTEEAIDYLREKKGHLMRGTRYAQVMSQLGARLIADGRRADAESAFEEALELQPDNPAVLNDLANLKKLQGDYQEAIERYNRALVFSPDDATVRSNLGAALLANGQVEEAIRQWEQSISAQPNLASTRQLLADTYRKMNKVDDALRHYEAAARSAPDNAPLWMNWGAALLSSGKFAHAASVLQEAANREPDNAAIQKNLAMALTLVGRKKDAVSAFERSVRLRPEDASVHYNLALLLYEQAELARAVEHLEKAIALRPGHAPYVEALQAIRDRR